MGSCGSNDVAVPRLKREGCERTKHDSAFSPWKVLVGPTDWEDYSSGKEGATRYRVYNLPKSPGPGIYELGVAASNAKSGHEITKLDLRFVAAVYLGQGDCVRTRLQQYGRSGAHLGKCSSAACEIDSKTSSPTNQLGLFVEALSRGYTIVFRWASLNNKGDAQRAEQLLLDKFDYAWNKGSNGSRRPCDIFKKLKETTPSTYHISSVARQLPPFRPRQVGIRIKGKLLSEKKDSFPQTGRESSSFFDGIFKFSKSRPRLIISESHADEDTTISGTSPANESFSPICGVILEDGFPCTKPPVHRRERCNEHKGMRIRASNPASSTKGTSNDIRNKLTMTSWDHAAEIHRLGKDVEVFSQQVNVKNDDGTVCGVDFGDGTFCTRRPARGRVRCEHHKGMRVNQTNPASSRKGASNDIPNKLTMTSRDHTAEIHRLGKAVEVFSQQVNVKNDDGTVCGVDIGDGTFCTTRPARGRVRCEQHKGMRVNQTNPASSRKGASNDIRNKLTMTSRDHTAEIHRLGKAVEVFSQQVNVKNNYGTVCGVDFGHGMFCTRRPARGRVRCEHHKGMRVN